LLYAHEPRDEYYGSPGAQWPAYFGSVADPIVSMAYVAAETDRIRLGSAVLNTPYTNPVLFAKQLGTLDMLSRGRVDVGVGLGWSRDEYRATGAQWSRRGARFDEFLDCVVRAWTEETLEYHGEFFEIPSCSIAPRPVQAPHPPLLVGGHGDAAMRRAVRFGQGYVAGNLALDAVAPLLARLTGFAEAAGRDPAGMRLAGRGTTKVFDRPQDENRGLLRGSLDQIVEDVQAYARAGFGELFLDLNMDSEFATDDPSRCLDTALALLERAA
jgi:probable F420-dependent oxidoreductase